MAIHEQTLNTTLAQALRDLRHLWAEPEGEAEITEEPTGALEGRGRPDILVHDPRRTPIVVETSFDPADAVRDAADDPARSEVDDAVGALLAADADEERAMLATFGARRGQLNLDPQVRGQQ